jgi:hypothetical protein
MELCMGITWITEPPYFHHRYVLPVIFSKSFPSRCFVLGPFFRVNP